MCEILQKESKNPAKKPYIRFMWTNDFSNECVYLNTLRACMCVAGDHKGADMFAALPTVFPLGWRFDENKADRRPMEG